MAEAVAMFVLPQLEGLSLDDAEPARDMVAASLDSWANDATIAWLDARFQEWFPGLRR